MRGSWRVERVRLRKSVKVERIEEEKKLGFKENVVTEIETETETETGRTAGAFNTMFYVPYVSMSVFFVKFPL